MFEDYVNIDEEIGAMEAECRMIQLEINQHRARMMPQLRREDVNSSSLNSSTQSLLREWRNEGLDIGEKGQVYRGHNVEEEDEEDEASRLRRLREEERLANLEDYENMRRNHTKKYIKKTNEMIRRCCDVMTHYEYQDDLIYEKCDPNVANEIRDERNKDTPSEPLRSAGFSHNDSLIELLLEQNAPGATLVRFSGDPLDFRMFRVQFENEVERKVSSDTGRLNRLLKYTEGTLAHDIIAPLIYLPNGYKLAKEKLLKEYENDNVISIAYGKKLREWPAVGKNDGVALQKFYLFLEKVKCSMDSNEFGLELNSQSNIRNLSGKLPVYLQDSWNRQATRKYESSSEKPTFQQFVDFVEGEYKVANNASFSRTAMAGLNLNENQGQGPTNSRSNYSSGSRSNYASGNSYKRIKSVATTTLATTFENRKKCPYCEMENHDELDRCWKFRKLMSQEKRAFILDRRLCFGCLQPCTAEHNVKTCKDRLTCTICKNRHATCLHQHGHSEPDKVPSQIPCPSPDNKSESDNTAPTNIQNSATSITTKPVTLSCILVDCLIGEKVVKCYCFLDTLSNTSFISRNFIDSLDKVESSSENVKLNTMSGSNSKSMDTVRGVRVRNLNGTVTVNLPKLYVENLPLSIDDIMTREKVEPWQYLHSIRDLLPEYDPSISVGLLIGNDVPGMLAPHDVIRPKNLSEVSGPYAVKYLLGWTVAGPTAEDGCREIRSCVTRTEADAVVLKADNEVRREERAEFHAMFKRLYEQDFHDPEPEKVRSVEDFKFMKMMTEETKLVPNGHYELPLAFKECKMPEMPDNRSEALSEAYKVRSRLLKSKDEEKQKMADFMNKMVDKGYARLVPEDQLQQGPGKRFYLVYHSVKHKKKIGKTRVVFNCARRHQGVSLNDKLMVGPTLELGNNMIGVQARWREEEEAFIADIEDMFYMNQVPEKQRTYLRYFWWGNVELNGSPKEFQMNVHCFGAVSSPSACNYALKRCAEDNADSFSEETVETVKRDFYVDDCLKSSSDVESAKTTVNEVRALCAKGGYNLRKFVSTNDEILSDLPEDCKLVVETLDLNQNGDVVDVMTVERVLGSKWNVTSDALSFEICLVDRPCTKRGLLSSISSIYDSQGLVSPYLLEGRKILQELSVSKYDWDDVVDDEILNKWQKWYFGLRNLETLSIPRCYKPKGFGKPVVAELHVFCDASLVGYGCGIYIRLENEKGEIATSLVMGKSRVSPLHGETIVRSELVAATIGAEIGSMLSRELTYSNLTVHYWTDSEVVLAYLKNDTKKFKTFVVNRIIKVKKLTDINNWNHVTSADNPSDDASRGLSAAEAKITDRWFTGPPFLSLPKEQWIKPELKLPELSEDPEIKRERLVVSASTIIEPEQPILKILARLSEWYKMRHVVASLLFMKPHSKLEITVAKMRDAETCILKLVQKDQLSKEIELLKNGKELPPGNSLTQLNVCLDQEGVVRVKGRLEYSGLDENLKNPVLIPKFSVITDAIIMDCHKAVNHCGRYSTINEIRNRGYWIVNMNSRVRYVIRRCVHCKKTRGKCGEQKMAQLPEERFQNAPPFTYCGVDIAGHFITKNGRKEQKRYVAVFTDLVYRGVHLEVCNSLETDSFMCAIRRFISRRGNVRYMKSDHGTNFVGYNNEVKAAMMELEPTLREYMLQNGCDLEWSFTKPKASHSGGIWERQINTMRRIMESVLRSHPGQLNDEGFVTLIAEVECTINCRPITVDTISDVDSPIPLSVMNILTQKTKLVLPAFGDFNNADLYSKRQWRRVQHLANEVWVRFRKEYLAQLQEFAKWTQTRRNVQVNDIVMLKDESLCRNDWKLCRIVETYTDNSGLVRSAKVQVGRVDLKSQPKFFDRPITKLIMILEAENSEINVKADNNSD